MKSNLTPRDEYIRRQRLRSNGPSGTNARSGQKRTGYHLLGVQKVK